MATPFIKEALQEVQLSSPKERELVKESLERLEFGESLDSILGQLQDIKDIAIKCESDPSSYHELNDKYRQEILDLLQLLKYPTLIILFHLIGDLEFEDILLQVGADSNFQHKQTFVLNTGSDFVENICAMTSTLANQLHYLGPLRKPPKLVYDNTVPNTKSVGVAGQYFVAALHSNRNRIVTFVDPSHIDGEVHQLPLESAFSKLLQYLDVCSSIEIEDNGAYGLKPLVVFSEATAEHKSLYTNVGVGVSQIAPLLLQLLLIDEYDCLLIEQPELHLHPAVQFKLGQLLYAQTRLKKQLIIETHSEHMINALRLSVAQGDIEPNQTALYFVTKSQQDNSSVVEKIDIEKNGFLSHWPSGFFDESEKASYQLLQKELNVLS